MKKVIKKLFNAFGLDIVRLNKSTHYTLLGLKKLSIKTIIDVGANEGQFAKMIGRIFPEAKIYCFEPLPDAFQELLRWAEKEGRGKVTSFNLALGEKEGVVKMFYHIEHSPSSSFLKTTELKEKYYPFIKKQIPVVVKMTTLDNWKNSLPFHLNQEILIKLDVQGYEDRVIKGGQEIFSMAKACILEVCLDQLYEEQATFKDIILRFYDLGYHYAGNLNQTYANDGHVIYIDAVFVRNK